MILKALYKWIARFALRFTAGFSECIARNPEYIPANAETSPEFPEYITRNPEYLPEFQQHTPENAEYLPEFQEHTPENAEYFPEFPEYIPVNAEYISEFPGTLARLCEDLFLFAKHLSKYIYKVLKIYSLFSDSSPPASSSLLS